MTDQDFSDKADDHTGQGRCPDCSGWFPVGGGGDLAAHDGTLIGLGGQCPGSERQPVEPVRCITCRGARKRIGSTGECSNCARKRRAAEWEAQRTVTGRGICPVCGGQADVMGTGELRYHIDGSQPWRACPGIGQAPAGAAGTA